MKDKTKIYVIYLLAFLYQNAMFTLEESCLKVLKKMHLVVLFADFIKVLLV